MRNRDTYFLILLIPVLLYIIPFLTSTAFSQEITEPPLPEGMIEEILADETIPDEIKRELEQALKGEGPEGVPPGIPILPPPDLPTEEEYLIEEEMAWEEPEPQELKMISPPVSETQPARGVVSSAASNKISLDLKGVDIIDVLKMLSARSNLNIIAGRNVRGKVTLFLKDVDVWDAFEIILAANDLAYEKEGDIINVMTERDYEQLYGEKYYTKSDFKIYRLEHAKVSEVSKALNQAKSKIGKVIVDEGSNTIVLIDSHKALAEMERMIAQMDMPVETKIFSLDYAKAEDVKTKISEMLTKNVGTIQVDERTNKIVITDLSKKIPDITRVVEEMDERHKEVLIEAKIVQIELNDQFQYGVDWKALFHKGPDEGLRFSLDNISGSVFDSAATGGALTIAQVAHDYIDTTIEILQTVGKTNVVSCPRITVLNNEEAKVLVGTNQPYVTTTTTVPEGGSSVTAESVTYIDVGIQLTVTPTINKDGYVTMKIKPEVSSMGTPLTTAQNNQIPVVSTSETETTVMVKDGHTIVIAGLIQDRDIVEEDKIPILGDIPILGNLFKNKTVGTTSQPEKEELVIFLTPYIVQGTETFPVKENVIYQNSLTQRDLLERQISLAVAELEEKRSLVREIPERGEEEPDKTTRLSEDIKWIPWEKGEAEEEKAEAAKKAEEVGTGRKAKEGAKEEKAASYYIPYPITGYYGYYENLRNRIYWVAKDYYPKDLAGRAEDVEIYFTLTSDGMLKDEPRVMNEVDEDLAIAAILTVKEAVPFPPFPQKMNRDQESFRITLTYQ